MTGRARDAGLLLLRAGFGGMLALHHGLPKALEWATTSGRFPDPLHVGHATSLALAIFGELVCGAAVALGLFTRAATVPAMVTMSVALFLVHGGDATGDGEMAFVYLLALATIALVGPGAWSLDGWMARKRDGWLPPH